MAYNFTGSFFFGQKVLEEEKRFSETVANLYIGIKEDEAAKFVQDEILQKFNKEIVGQVLTQILGCSFFDLQDKSMILCQRHLIAYHAKKAYQLKVHEKREWLNKMHNQRI